MTKANGIVIITAGGAPCRIHSGGLRQVTRRVKKEKMSIGTLKIEVLKINTEFDLMTPPPKTGKLG